MKHDCRTLWARARRRLRWLRANQRGIAAVEFAFVFPVMLLFLIGIIECGRIVWTNYSLQTAVEDTARYILANQKATDTQISTYVSGKLDLLDPTDLTISVARDTVTGVNFVSVSAVYSFTVAANIVPLGSFSLIGRSRIALTAP
jgi:Flp pilus assembly protein TadG